MSDTPISDKNKARGGARRGARKLLVQALYQKIMADTSILELKKQFEDDNDLSRVDKNYFLDLLVSLLQDVPNLDEIFKPHLDRAFDQLNPIELAILRLGTYELKRRPDVPYKVVINEAIELAKIFGGTDSHKYVNSILDQVALECRSAEIKNINK